MTGVRRVAVLLLYVCFLQTPTVGLAREEEAELQPWTSAAIVETKRIATPVIAPDGSMYAFIARSPSLVRNSDGFQLISGSIRQPNRSRILMEARFLADLRIRPGTNELTVRADMGNGIQLYSVSTSDGSARTLVERPPVLSGGETGEMLSAFEAPRLTGILSYGWSPDGSQLWYTTFRQKTADEISAESDRGVVHDPRTYLMPDSFYPANATDVELRHMVLAGGQDVMIARAASHRMQSGAPFYLIEWPSSSSVRFTRRDPYSRGFGQFHTMLWSHGSLRHLSSSDSFPSSSRLRVGNDELAVAGDGSLTLNGDEVAKFAGTTFRRSAVRDKSWMNKQEDQVIFSTTDMTRAERTLLFFNKRNGLRRLTPTGYSFHDCSFNVDVSIGVCIRESQVTPPELYRLDIQGETAVKLTSINDRISRFTPLIVEPRTWTNALGMTVSGWVTYPRNYKRGSHYPAVVVTHGRDAINLFAWQAFQWEFPLQRLAEDGFFIVSVNEPDGSNGRAITDVANGPARERANLSDFPISTLQSVVDDLAGLGYIDRKRVGIVGYSAGGSLAIFAMHRSRLFATGINGVSAGYISDLYWFNERSKAIARGFFGGSPLEEGYKGIYYDYAADLRADRFSGGLLQILTGPGVVHSKPLDNALTDASVPSEIVFYRGETHAFHAPRRRLDAMNLSRDWLRFWLSGVETEHAEDKDRYSRWRNLRGKHCKLFEPDYVGHALGVDRERTVAGGSLIPWYCKAENVVSN